MNLLRVLYYRWKVRGAVVDEQYFREETKRCIANVRVARDRRSYWMRKMYDAQYPVRGAGRLVNTR